MLILSQVLLSQTMKQRHQSMRAKGGMMFGPDKFKEPAAGLWKAKLAYEAQGRDHGRPLLLCVELDSESLNVAIQRFLLFGIHPADGRGHQITHCLIEFVVSGNEQLEQSLSGCFTAHRTENAGGIQ